MGDQEQAAVEAQRQVDLTKIPFFHGDIKKDQFTPEQWIDRVNRARVAGNWNDEKTASYLYNSFRDKALTWFRTLHLMDADNTSWNDIKQEFLEAYGTASSARITITSFGELQQGKTETVTDFYARVGEVMCNYLEHMPEEGLGVKLPTAQEQPNAAWIAVPDAVKTAVAKHIAIDQQTRAVKYMGAQIFVSGLQKDVRLKVAEANPADIKQAHKAAREYERIHAAEKANETKLSEMEAEQEDPEEAAELEAIRNQHKQKRMFKANNGSAYQTRSYANYGSNGANGSTWTQGGQGNANNSKGNGQSNEGPRKSNPAAGKTCHYCKKKNHFQQDCHKRKRDNAPLVKPVHENTTEENRPHPNEEMFYQTLKN